MAILPKNLAQTNAAAIGSPQVTPENFNTFVQWCDTAANLRTFVGQDGMTVELQGIMTADDGQGGVFRWSQTSTATDDNADVIAPNGPQGRWLRVVTPGSSGIEITDGTHDVTGATKLTI